MLEMKQLISMVLKDSGVMPKHGYIIIEVYRSHTLISLLKRNRIQIQSQKRRYLQNTHKHNSKICSKSLGITYKNVDKKGI